MNFVKNPLLAARVFLDDKKVCFALFSNETLTPNPSDKENFVLITPGSELASDSSLKIFQLGVLSEGIIFPENLQSIEAGYDPLKQDAPAVLFINKSAGGTANFSATVAIPESKVTTNDFSGVKSLKQNIKLFDSEIELKKLKTSAGEAKDRISRSELEANERISRMAKNRDAAIGATVGAAVGIGAIAAGATYYRSMKKNKPKKDLKKIDNSLKKLNAKNTSGMSIRARKKLAEEINSLEEKRRSFVAQHPELA